MSKGSHSGQRSKVRRGEQPVFTCSVEKAVLTWTANATNSTITQTIMSWTTLIWTVSTSFSGKGSSTPSSLSFFVFVSLVQHKCFFITLNKMVGSLVDLNDLNGLEYMLFLLHGIYKWCFLAWNFEPLKPITVNNWVPPWSYWVDNQRQKPIDRPPSTGYLIIFQHFPMVRICWGSLWDMRLNLDKDPH